MYDDDVKTNQTVAVAGGRALLEVEIGKFCLTTTHISLCKKFVTKAELQNRTFTLNKRFSFIGS